MKTQVMNCAVATFNGRIKLPRLRLDTGSALQVVLLILAATAPAVLVSITTIWAIGSGLHEYVSAIFWASGFIFLALMVDNENGHGTLLAASGLTLMGLAWMSSRIAPEFGVLAGFLLAAWVAVPVVRLVQDAGRGNKPRYEAGRVEAPPSR